MWASCADSPSSASLSRNIHKCGVVDLKALNEPFDVGSSVEDREREGSFPYGEAWASE